MFLFQVLSTDGSCREAVRQFLVWIAMENCTASQNTSAYTKARQRLRLSDLEEVNDSLIEQLDDMRQPEDLWMGRDVKVFDGSSLSMPDKEELQVLYPQPKSQKKGCGFPTMRIMAAFSLATGTLITLTRSALSIGENTLFRNMWDILDPGDVVLADRYFCNYTNFFYLLNSNILIVSCGTIRGELSALILLKQSRKMTVLSRGTRTQHARNGLKKKNG